MRQTSQYLSDILSRAVIIDCVRGGLKYSALIVRGLYKCVLARGNKPGSVLAARTKNKSASAHVTAPSTTGPYCCALRANASEGKAKKSPMPVHIMSSESAKGANDAPDDT